MTSDQSCRLGSCLKAGNPLRTRQGPLRAPSARICGHHSPAFAIGLMAVDGKSKGTHMDSGTVGSAFPDPRDGVLDALLHPLHQLTVSRH